MRNVFIEAILALILNESDMDPIHESGLDSLTSLCLMSVNPTGNENPKELCSKISNEFLDVIILNKEKFLLNPTTKKILPILVIEWCYRKNHLLSDWKWEWKGKQGELKYLSNIPIEKIEFPTKDKT